MDEKVSNLLAVLQDINRDEVITELNKLKENSGDCNIIHGFLKKYFGSKDTYEFSNVYYEEAVRIVKIFPQYSVEYIKSMLKALRNEDNRIIVILRLLLKNEFKHNKNKILPENFVDISQAESSSTNDKGKYDELKSTSFTIFVFMEKSE